MAAFRAILTAEREVGGSAIEIDSDYKRWEVDVLVDWTEHELDISTDGDTLLRNENSDADTDDFRRLAAVTHSMAEATMVALENTPGDVAEVSLQTTNGTVIWDVTIEQESGGFAYVGINAGTGEVIR
ncbi:MAG: PepSY domain-containing protein [Propionicimonas sp.]